MKVPIKLEVFEGPFDLLFHLIEKNQVDIYHIPMAEMVRQYLDYLDEMQSLDLDIASEFLVMAATLLAIKAKMLLPKPLLPEGSETEEEDPRDALVEQLLTYKKYKAAAEYLRQEEARLGKIHFRPNEENFFLSLFADKNPLEGVSLADLGAALHDVLARLGESAPVEEIYRQEVTIKQKIADLKAILKDHPQGISFRDLFAFPVGKVEVVVQFLALLELMRLKMIRVSQDAPLGSILIFPASAESRDVG